MSRIPGLAAAIAVVSCLVFASAASAELSITNWAVTPSSPGIGRNPDVRVSAQFSYNPVLDDVRSARISLPPGLLANLTAVSPLCTAAQLQSFACPASTRVGGDPTGGGENSISVEAQLDGDPEDELIVADTDLFVVEPQGPGELAQLGIVASLGGNPIVALAAPITLRPDLGLDMALTDLPRMLFELVPIRVVGMDVTINGLVNGTGFTRMPSSCAPADYRLAAASYDAPAQAKTATSPFAALGCPNGLSFAPQISGEITKEAGSNAIAFKTTLTQAAGEAAVKGAALILPGGLAPRLPDALTRACPVSTQAADCPATAKVGTLTATTPILPTPLTGDVLLRATGGVMPSLGLFIRTPLSIELLAGVGFGSGTLTTTLDGNVPDIPLTSLEVSLDGGPSSVMTAGGALCSTDQLIKGDFTAQSGTTARDSAKAAVHGCGGSPEGNLTGKVRFRGLATRQPRMGFAIRATKGSPRITGVTLKLPKGLRVVRRRLPKGLKLRADSKPLPRRRIGSTRGVLRIRRTAASTLTGTLSGAALKVDPRLKRSVRAGRAGRLTVVAQVSRTGATSRTLRLTAKAR